MMEAVRAVQLVKATQTAARFDRFDFFTKNDVWLFVGELDDRSCERCISYDGLTFTGEVVLGLFPWLEVETLMTIRPIVHPNCRCTLERVSPIKPDLEM